MAQLLISAGQVLLGPAGKRIINAAVLIDGNRITAVGPRQETQALARADVVEHVYPEGTALPGLLNCHVHLALDAGADRLMTATVPLTAPGGHCWFLGGEVNSDEAIRQQIRSNVENGATSSRL